MALSAPNTAKSALFGAAPPITPLLPTAATHSSTNVISATRSSSSFNFPFNCFAPCKKSLCKLSPRVQGRGWKVVDSIGVRETHQILVERPNMIHEGATGHANLGFLDGDFHGGFGLLRGAENIYVDARKELFVCPRTPLFLLCRLSWCKH